MTFALTSKATNVKVSLVFSCRCPSCKQIFQSIIFHFPILSILLNAKMEPMKVSFGFNKTAKRTNIFSSQAKQEVKKVDLVECLEGQSIKVKDAVEEVKQPLVIPLKDDQKNLLDRVRAAKKRDRQEESKQNDQEDTRPDSELSVDELAARQLIKEAKDKLTNGYSTNNSTISILPLKQEAQSLEGEKEPTLDDYESVPISDYGLAILRGMGWKEGMAIGKNSSKSIAVTVPELRPKGLGLGATKVVQSEMPAKKAVDNDGKELILVKGAYAKVIAGPHKGQYCEVQGFDEEAGRVIIKVHPAGDIVNINELMLAPVTKEEFSKGSKILNNAKYEEYKEISDKKLDNYKVKQEVFLSRKIKEEKNSSDSDGQNNKTERNCLKDEQKSHYNPRSSENDGDKKSSKNKEQSKSTSKHRESVSSDREYSKRNSHKKEKKTRTDDRSPSYSSSKYKSNKRHDTDSSDSEYQKKDKIRSSVKQKSKNRRSRSRSRYSSSKKDNTKYGSSDEDSHEKVKKSSRHSKSKNRDRSRSKSGDRHRKNKKHSSHHRDSSESDSGKKERRKKNKCKSRHRRNSSSSSEERQYRSKR